MASRLAPHGMTALLALALLGCAGSDNAKTAAPAAAAAPGHWISDAASQCRFWTVDPAFVSGKWAGQCSDGLATGDGIAFLASDPIRKEPPVPPFTGEFTGRFAAGKPDGLALVRYSSGVTEVATYREGRRTGPVWLHVLAYGQDAWGMASSEAMPESAAGVDLRRVNALPPAFPAGSAPALPHLSVAEWTRAAHLFDFSRFSDLETARSAIDQVFPVGRRAPELITLLDTAAQHRNGTDIVQVYFHPPTLSYCKQTTSLATVPNLGWMCVVSYRVAVANGNANLWVYTVLLDNETQILASELRLYFDDQHFASRHVPLNAENFATDDNFIRAAQEVLGAKPSPDAVTKLMVSAGLKRGRLSPGNGDPTARPIEFYGAGFRILAVITGCSRSLDLVWTFEANTGALRDVKPGTGGQVCA